MTEVAVTRAHSPRLLVLYGAWTVVMLLMFLFNAGSAANFMPGVYVSTTGNISDMYSTLITPAGWTFSIWGLIYAFQAAFLLYGLSTLFRRGPDGWLYRSPGLLPPELFILYIVNNVLNVGWLVAFDREQMVVSQFLAAGMAGTIYMALGRLYAAESRCVQVLVEHKLVRELWLVRACVENAFGIYCTWVTIATLLNLNIVLVYYAGASHVVGSSIALGILHAVICVWTSLDLGYLRRYTNYLLTPYFVVPFALTGAFVNNFDDWKGVNIYTLVILCYACVMLVVKLGLTLSRHKYLKHMDPANQCCGKNTCCKKDETELEEKVVP